MQQSSQSIGYARAGMLPEIGQATKQVVVVVDTCTCMHVFCHGFKSCFLKVCHPIRYIWNWTAVTYTKYSSSLKWSINWKPAVFCTVKEQPCSVLHMQFQPRNICYDRVVSCFHSLCFLLLSFSHCMCSIVSFLHDCAAQHICAEFQPSIWHHTALLIVQSSFFVVRLKSDWSHAEALSIQGQLTPVKAVYPFTLLVLWIPYHACFARQVWTLLVATFILP